MGTRSTWQINGMSNLVNMICVCARACAHACACVNACVHISGEGNVVIHSSQALYHWFAFRPSSSCHQMVTHPAGRGDG